MRVYLRVSGSPVCSDDLPALFQQGGSARVDSIALHRDVQPEDYHTHTIHSVSFADSMDTTTYQLIIIIVDRHRRAQSSITKFSVM